jgi:hypothetical protein
VSKVSKVSKQTKASGQAKRSIDESLAPLWHAIAAGDVLDAEVQTAARAAAPELVDTFNQSQRDTFTTNVLVRRAREKDSPDGAALLHLLVHLGSPGVKREARLALGELTARDIYPPEWITEIGKPVPGEAWLLSSVFGDVETVLMTFRYGEAEHLVAVQVETAAEPIAVRITLSRQPASVLGALREDDDPMVRIDQIGLGEARGRVEAALTRAGREMLSEGFDSYASLPIARSRVRRLPEAPPPQPPAREFTDADRAAAVDEFMKSAPAAEAVAADEDTTRYWAEAFAGFSALAPGHSPAQIGPRVLSSMLLTHIPRTMSPTDEQVARLYPAATAWTRWTAGRQGLDEAALASLEERLAEVMVGWEDEEG